MLGQEYQSVVRAKRSAVLEFVNVSSALEAELFKYGKGSINTKAVDIHNTRLLYNVVGIIFLVDRNCDPIGSVCHLCYRVDDKTVVLFAVV